MLSAVGHALVQHEDHDAHEDHDGGNDVGLSRIAVYERSHLGGQHVKTHRRTEEYRHGISAHGTGEHQQEGGHHGRFHDRKRDTPDNARPAGSQDRGRLFKIGIHVPQHAADQDEGIGGIMQSQYQ